MIKNYKTLDVKTVNIDRDLLKAAKAFKVIDINLKGILNSKYDSKITFTVFLSFTRYRSFKL